MGVVDDEHPSQAFPGETHVDVLGGWGAEWTAGDEDWRYHQFTRQDHGDIDVILKVHFDWSPDDDKAPAQPPEEGTAGGG